jgi:hypothetical protein
VLSLPICSTTYRDLQFLSYTANITPNLHILIQNKMSGYTPRQYRPDPRQFNHRRVTDSYYPRTPLHGRPTVKGSPLTASSTTNEPSMSRLRYVDFDRASPTRIPTPVRLRALANSKHKGSTDFDFRTGP